MAIRATHLWGIYGIYGASTMLPWEVLHLRLQPRRTGTAYRMAPVRHRL